MNVRVSSVAAATGDGVESLSTTRDLVPPAGPSIGEGAAVGVLDMLSAEGGQPNEHQYANLCATNTNVKQESAMQR